MVKFKYEAFGFKFQTVQLVDIRYPDGLEKRVIGTKSLKELVDAKKVTVIRSHVTLSISHGEQQVFVPLMEVDEI